VGNCRVYSTRNLHYVIPHADFVLAKTADVLAVVKETSTNGAFATIGFALFPWLTAFGHFLPFRPIAPGLNCCGRKNPTAPWT